MLCLQSLQSWKSLLSPCMQADTQLPQVLQSLGSTFSLL